MLLDLIERYYKFLWFAFGAIAFLKVILSYYFHGELVGMNGIIYALFKWYGDDEQEMEEFGRRRTLMRIHNTITLLIYVMLLIILIATLLPMFIGR
jgi:hypothetical protein